MRVGIMGGTLDPVHNGHIQIAQAALEMLGLDRVMLLPAGDPPHKAPPTSKEDRLEMARLAAADCEGMFVCAMEILRSGTTYTVDTLRQLSQMNPNTQWYYLVGADTLEALDTWRSFAEVAKLCTFVVIGRAEEAANLERARKLEQRYGTKFVLLPFNGPDISSTDVRNRIARGENVDELVPTSVGKFITDQGLYLCGRSWEEILATLKGNLKPGRYIHTLGVAETACRLAPRYGVDARRAELAALLHDCAKYLPVDEMKALALQANPPADGEEMQAISVLHAPAGAAMAAQRFGVQDLAILSAIRKHTIGDGEMSALDALIYVADFIEPNREPFPGLEEARALAETDILAATVRCGELTNHHIQTQGKQPHPRSLAMIEKYK